jgi:putative ABC transport system permease protein
MRWIYKIPLRLRSLFRKKRAEEELSEEMQFHLEKLIEANIVNGMSAEEARYAALREFGGVEQLKEECRDSWGVRMVSELGQDIRYGLRQLRRNPGFTAVAVLTLALGIGANTAIFSVINSLFLRPPGLPNPDRVVAVRGKYDKLGLKSIVISAPDFAGIRDSRKIFAAAAIENDADFNYTASDWPRRLQGAMVSWQWFDVFGARPILGRTFTPEEDQPNANQEVVLAYGAWQRWFGGDRGVIGRTIQLNEQPFKIIGVMGPEFRWPDSADLWTPIGLAPEAFNVNNTFNENYFAVARLQPNVTFAQASAYVGVLVRRVVDNPASTYAKDSGWSVFILPLVDFIYGNLRTPVLILAGAVGLVLLIVCANIAGLLLAKATGRGRELAVRSALGASRRRLVRQALAESTLLSLAGILVGLLFASVGINALMLIAPKQLVAAGSFPLDWHVLVFTVGLGAVAVFLFGLMPAWQMSRVEPYQVLRGSERTTAGGRQRHRLRSFLVVGELAMGLVLLAGTGLLLQSLAQILTVNPGFQPNGVMTAGLSLPDKQYGTKEKQFAFFRSVMDNLSHTPGVIAVGAGYPVPFTGGNQSASFQIEGRPAGPGDPGPHGNIRYVTGGYFTALGIPLLQGRFFDQNDRLGSEAVAIIDTNLAHEYWPNQNPIGQKIRNGRRDPWATIVGIVGHIRFNQLAGEESGSNISESAGKGVYYYPLLQKEAPYGYFVAKSSAGPAAQADMIRRAVRAVDPNQPVSDVRTMDERIATSLAPQRFAATLLAVFAALAVLLAALGLYGLMSHSVSQRTSEIGIRMALGADRAGVVALFVKDGLRLALAGVALGLAGALVLARFLASLVYGVKPTDPLTFIAVSFILGAVALLACYIPARRAAKVDPMVALRYE